MVPTTTRLYEKGPDNQRFYAPDEPLARAAALGTKDEENRNNIHVARLNVLPTTKEDLSQKANSVHERDVTKDADAVTELRRLGYQKIEVVIAESLNDDDDVAGQNF